MNILLLQPPDAPAAVEPRDSAYGHSLRLAPSWDLLCLRAFLLNRTRFGCEVVDARCFTDLERQLAERVSSIPDLHLAVILTSSLGLGATATVIEALRRIAPSLKIAICGQHPTQFPKLSDALPDVDYALCGDPEPILRNLADYLDVDNRLRRAPGLRMAGQPPVEPYWLPDLKALPLPDWSGVTWGSYSIPLPRQGAMAEMRLSRGHTRTPADRAHGGMDAPLRIWPFDRAAAALQKCASAGVVEVAIHDPPGFWTDARLQEWCSALRREHNTQAWSLQLLPRSLPDDLVQSLQIAACRRVEFLMPSAQPDTLARYGSTVSPAQLSSTVSALQSTGIEVETRFWVGGPEEEKGERERIVRLLGQIRYCPFSLHAFPLAFDAPLYGEIDAPGKPSIESWIKWARDPWMVEKPTALWGDQKAIAYIERTMAQVEQLILNSPRHRLLHALDRIRTTRFIESMENLALGFMRKASEPPRP